MRDVLIEVGTEEMPHTYIISMLSQIEKGLPSLLDEYGVEYEDYKLYATPRRFAIYIKGVQKVQKVKEEEIKGPPVAVAYKDGEPTKALFGFLKKNGADPSDVTLKKEGKKEYVYIKVKKGGAPVETLIPEIIGQLITSLRFPKMMRWGRGEYQFGRPVRWLVALYGDDIIPMTLFGIKADRFSRGLRIFAGDVKIDKAEDYVLAMENDGIVIPDPGVRRDIIRESIEEKAASVGGVPEIDEDLLEEVNYLVEYPTPFLGNIEEKFLSLPEIVVITVMKHHQRYFPVRDKEGKLLPYFIGVRNGPAEGIENVIKGNEKVIRARLYDAVFFFEEDKKKSLDEWRKETDTIPFFEDMGSYLDKSERVKKLVDSDIRKRIAHLMYADLPTNMVREFTELHGFMGKEYYKDEDEYVAQGILDTIFPLYGEYPKTEDGAYVGLMDRLDTLATAAIKGIKIKGGGDIFGIRRAAMGIIGLLDKMFPSLIWRDIAMAAAKEAASFFGKEGVDDIYAYMTDVVKGRFRSYFSEFPYEVLTASMVCWEEKPFGAIRAVAETLMEALSLNKDMLEAIAFGHKRIENILKGEKDLVSNVVPQGEWEEKLYAAVKYTENVLDKLNIANKDDVKKALDSLKQLADVLAGFFDNVLVNDKDEEVRKRRKSLLALAGSVFEKVARFNKLGL